MDIVTEMIGSIRAGSSHARRIRESGSWGARYPPIVGIGFHLVLSGTGWLIAKGGESTALEPGSIVLVPSGAEHGLSRTPCKLAVLPAAIMSAEPPSPGPYDFEFVTGCYRLDLDRIHHFLRELPDVVAISPDYDRYPQLLSLTALLGDDVSETRPGTGATRAALLDLVLVHALRQWLEQSNDRAWPPISDPGIAAALRAIHGEPERQWTVQRLGEIAGMSRSVFTRRFTALIGKPPMAYVIGWRLTSAARLLRETREPLAAIAPRVGYSTEFALATAFRREYGISPGKFRRNVGTAQPSPVHG